MIIVVNKADCPQQLEIGGLQTLWPGVPVVSTSMLTGKGLPDLEQAIADLVLAGRTLYGESALITSARHQEALRRAAENLRASSISRYRAPDSLSSRKILVMLRAARRRPAFLLIRWADIGDSPAACHDSIPLRTVG